MKDRPIIFSGEMVRSILGGRKTMTRRPLKPKPPEWKKPEGDFSIIDFREHGNSGNFRWLGAGLICERPPWNKIWRCPYGIPGNRLWVRETWAIHPRFKTLLYRADGEEYKDAPGYGIWKPAWKPSIYMPRRVSRITLEITNVRVEKVQEISLQDAESEGMYKSGHCSIINFIRLWNTIYTKKPEFQWDKNPWVWVIEFRRINP